MKSNKLAYYSLSLGLINVFVSCVEAEQKEINTGYLLIASKKGLPHCPI